MHYLYTYKITFVDGCYYFGSRKSKIRPENDIYWGSPKTHKNKWNTTMFYKTILNVFKTCKELQEEEIRLIRPVYKTDPHCLNENCGGVVNFTPEIRLKLSEALKGKFVTDKTRKKMSASSKGKPKSTKAREKMSSSSRGKFHSEETKQKISNARKGKPGPWSGKRWITNGSENLSIPRDTCIPEGYRLGRTL